jgi:hypothetical protein
MKRPTTDQSRSAGRSAATEYERRSEARRSRLRVRYGVIGSAVAALAGDPSHLAVWQQGAEGEVATARRLEAHLRRTDVVLLHDRRIPGRGRANIDHVAIGPGGITVIDTKSSRGHVRLATVGLVNRREVLFVGRWDRTRDFDAVERQVDAITRRLRRIGIDVGGDVRGALCFPYMRRTWLHRSWARGGLITVDDPRHIARLIRRPGGLSTDEIARLTQAISQLFPPAAR